MIKEKIIKIAQEKFPNINKGGLKEIQVPFFTDTSFGINDVTSQITRQFKVVTFRKCTTLEGDEVWQFYDTK